MLDAVIAKHPHEVWPLSIKAAVFSGERRADEALAAHAAIVAKASHAAAPWMNYAHALKTVGNTEAAITAYRNALERDPMNGSCWWGLANLRTLRLKASDVSAMEKALPHSSRNPLQQIHLHFALGKGLGDLGHYEQSFGHYQEANRLRGRMAPHAADEISTFVNRCETLFTPEFFAERNGVGFAADDVIFIVGMPRSGSTLIEQILASHPMVEGARELFELRTIARRIAVGATPEAAMPEAIAGLSAADFTAIGERYLQSVQRYRRSDRPFFTDKMPANWQLVPLIHLALPNAKIIDMRRNPLSCCLSSFATYFNLQTSFPTNLEDLASYYQDYARLMKHMDTVLPDRIHRIHYEQLVDDLELEVRRLLDFLGLPFHPACLRFHETERAVHTPSAQQVRNPINRDGLDAWRNYEPMLTPLQKTIALS